MVLTEIAGSTLTAVGLVLLVAALGIRLAHGSWSETQAVTFDHRGHPYLRWHDHRYRIVEALWSSGLRRRRTSQPPPLGPGTDVTIYYRARDPEQWSLQQPYRATRLTAVLGLGCAVVGTLVGFLPF
jgi:hypothetical protein